MECIKYHAVEKGTLQAFVDIFIPKWGVEIYGLKIFMKDGKKWVGFPSKEYQGDNGEKKYSPYFRFPNKEHQDAFFKKVLDAVSKFCNDKPRGETKQEEFPF